MCKIPFLVGKKNWLGISLSLKERLKSSSDIGILIWAIVLKGKWKTIFMLYKGMNVA